MIINSHNPSDLSDKMQKESQDYVEALEEELRKIRVFQRELPLCLEILTQAIETCKQQLSGTTTAEYNYLPGQFECHSEQTSSDVPVFEEFIPLKRASSRHSDGEEEESGKQRNEISPGGDRKKSDWLKSVQLWNQTPDPLSIEDSARKVAVVEVNGNGGGGGAFHPFEREGNVGGGGTPTAPMQEPMSSSVPPASTSSTAETDGGIKKAEKELQSERKARRYWSPELHRRFLEALQQLGGSHVATPKQIKELMRVDGLTNDEIKSHLQKFRLHTRRQNLSIRNNSINNNAQSPQFVVVGGMWAPPECAAAVATTTTSGEATGVATPKGIYAPVATLPFPPPFQDASASLKQRQEKEPSHSNDRGRRGEGGFQSYSPASSSSMQPPPSRRLSDFSFPGLKLC